MLHSFRDDVRRRFIVTASGSLSFAHLMTFLRSQLSQDAWDYSVLHDFRAATTDATPEDSAEMAGWSRQTAMARARGPVAIVTVDPALAAASREYARLVARAGGLMAVFDDIDAAKRWLDRQAAQPSQCAG